MKEAGKHVAFPSYHDDIYIMMKCMCVTKNHHFLLGVSCNHPGWFFMVLGRFLWFFMVLGQVLWFFKVPGRFFYGFSWFEVGFSWLQVGFMVIQGSRVVFQGSGSVFMIFYSSRSVFMVFMILGRFLWFQVSLHPSWALKARSEMLTTPQKVPAWSVSWPRNPARPCRP